LGYGKAADEGEVEARGSRKFIGLEVVGEEDSVGLRFAMLVIYDMN
jgi:hypothetical protein